MIEDMEDAMTRFKLNRNKFSTDAWQPSKRNVELLVKRGCINALWLYTDCEDIPMLTNTDITT